MAQIHKYTTKELTYIQGDHDVFNCDIADCETCNNYFKYQAAFKKQSDIIDMAERGSSLVQIADTMGVAQEYVQRTVLAVTGMTISAMYTQRYQDRLKQYVNDGLSVVAIGRKVKKPVSTVRGYLSHNSIKYPDYHSTKVDIVTSKSGDIRYFDSKGKEIVMFYKGTGSPY